MTTDSFDAYLQRTPDETFTDWLRERSEPAWSETVDHRFVRELGAGTVDDDAFRRSLVQDYAFVESLTGLVGRAIADAPSMEAKRRLGTFLATLTSEENDYFERSFDALDVPEADRTDPDRLPVTEALEDLLGRAGREGDYEETLAVLLPGEWCYLAWASDLADADPDAFYLAEWIGLHAVEDFAAFVSWLRGKLDRRGQELPPRRRRRVARHFRRTMTLERAFFDAAYDAPRSPD
ncbi:MAG: thiaminase/transcriptional activator TenA [Halobacteriales archaeon]|jgi:thiaminase/transcriptional activator TenA